MNPKHMTNDSDRVAPGRRIHLPSPTSVRPRRRIAAGVLSLLLGLSCFAASPAWALKLGDRADDRPSGIQKYDSVADYLGDRERNSYRHVQIGEYILPRDQVEAFYRSLLAGETEPSLAEREARLIASYDNVAAYREDSESTNRLYADIEKLVYRVTDLETLRRAGTLSDSNLPDPVGSLASNIGIFGNTAVGHRASATGYYSTAIGYRASATGDRATAIGDRASATGDRATAIGDRASATGDRAIAIGNPATTTARSLGAIAIGMESQADGWKSIAIGAHARTREAAAVAVGRSSSAYAHSVAVGVGAEAAAQSSIALGHGASASATGTEGIALGLRARATGTKGIAIGSHVSAGQNEVVVGTDEHTYKLPGLRSRTSGTRVVTVDSKGRLSTQAAASSSSRGASLRGASALSSEATALDRDMGTRTDAADYEEAPAIGSGPTAPETADQRRVVVQDTNRDGSVRLRTLDFSDLSGMDRRLDGVEQRVSSLSDRLNKATAMSAALSALPNVVPGDNRFFLGVGAGHYSSEQALAIGMSARVGRHVFVNAGAALASGDDASVRGGVGIVW